MATPLFLKSDTFGSFEQIFIPFGGTCPPGQVPTQVECFMPPCPELCVAGESMVLSGEPLIERIPPTVEETLVSPAVPGMAPNWLIAALVAVPVLLMLGTLGKRGR